MGGAANITQEVCENCDNMTFQQLIGHFDAIFVTPEDSAINCKAFYSCKQRVNKFPGNYVAQKTGLWQKAWGFLLDERVLMEEVTRASTTVMYVEKLLRL